MKTLAVAATALLTSFAQVAFSESLDDISKFAREICDSIGTEGSITRQQIEGALDGEAKGTFVKLIGASLTADGRIKIDETHYYHLPHEALPAQMQDARACRKEIAELLLAERQVVEDIRRRAQDVESSPKDESQEAAPRGALYLPTKATFAYLFVQEVGPDGGPAGKADLVAETPEIVVNEINQHLADASALPNRRVVLTVSDENDDYSIGNLTKYCNKRLKKATYINPYGKSTPSTGYLVPFECN